MVWFSSFKGFAFFLKQQDAFHLYDQGLLPIWTLWSPQNLQGAGLLESYRRETDA